MTKSSSRKILCAAAVAFVFALLAFAAIVAHGTAFADGSSPAESADNRLTDGTGGQYVLPSGWVYGTTQNISAPVLEVGNELASTHTHVSIAVEKSVPSESGDETETVLIASDFPVADIPYYVNGYMPVGDYTLTVDVDEITSSDSRVYAAFSESFEFSVTSAEISEKIKTELAEKIDGRLFTYVYDGGAHFIPDDLDCAAFAGDGVIYDRGEDNYWATEAADEYFDDGFAVTFNLSRMMNNHYHSAEYLVGDEADCDTAAPVQADKYTVYYQLEARNYRPLVDVDNESRKQSLFYVTVVKEVAVPVYTAVYNGEAQAASIDDEYMPYSVVENDGGTAAGKYKVVLRLRDPEICMWKGQTLGDRAAEIETEFEITKASNGWTTVPDIVRWKEGEYDPTENTVAGAALFGTVNIIITDADDNVVFDKLSGVDKLRFARAGVYTLTAYVTGTDDYAGIEGDYVYSKTFKVYAKDGIAWWGIMLIVIAALAVVAIVVYLLGVFDIVHLWSRKKVATVRAQASVDATIAAVRVTQAAREQAAASAATPIDRAEPTEAESESDNIEPETVEYEKSDRESSQAAALEQRAREAEERAELYAAQAKKMTEIAAAARQQAAALAALDKPSEKAEAPAATDEKTEAKEAADEAETIVTTETSDEATDDGTEE